MISPWFLYAGAFLAAALVGLWLTPRVREAAVRFGIVDRPDGRLKTQGEPVAYLGGVAVFLAFLLAISLVLRFETEVLGFLLAGSIVVLVGLVDDLGSLTPWQKLAGQGIAILVLVKSGIVIQLTFLPEWVAIPLSVLWLLAATNAFNLIDIMDGLSSGTAVVAALALLVVADENGKVSSAVLMAALAGAALGFLRSNFQPARIYLGDAGSLFLGLMLGAVAMDNAYTGINPLGALAPALILGVPLFDMLFVMYIRRRRGLPVMLGSPDHVALRLRKWKLSVKQTVSASYLATAVLGGSAVAMTRVSFEAAAAILAVLVAAGLLLALFLNRIDMSL